MGVCAPKGPEQGGVSEFVLSGSYTGVVLLLFSFTTFLRNAGERDLVRDHGALAVAQVRCIGLRGLLLEEMAWDCSTSCMSSATSPILRAK